MACVAFLPTSSANHLLSVIGNDRVVLANSWPDLDSLIRDQTAKAAVVDPTADGTLNISAVLSLIRKYPSVPVLAYVPLTEQSFRAAFVLSTHGLSRVLVYPLARRDLQRTIETVSAGQLANDFLGFMEPSLGRLNPRLLRVTQDLFDRPRRYESVADLAIEAKMSVRQVYRAFHSAKLGRPKRLVSIARLLRAYQDLQEAHDPITTISMKLGYGHRSVLAEHVQMVFGCSPSQLRFQASREEVIVRSLEWLYRPARCLSRERTN